MPGLLDIKGIGEKARDALVDAYGSEEDAHRALFNMEFDQLFSCNAIPVLKRVQIAREVFSEKMGFGYTDLMKTPDARRIYSSVMDILGSYATTAYGKGALGLWYPTTDHQEIKRRQEKVDDATNLVRALGRERLGELKRALSRINPIKRGVSFKLSDALVTDDAGIFDLMKTYTADAMFLEDEGDIASLEAFSLVRLVQGDNSRMSALTESLPNVEISYGFKVEDCLPEAVLELFIRNQDAIISGADALNILGKDVPPGFDQGRDSLEKAASILEEVKDETLAGVDTALDGFAKAEEDFQQTAGDCLVMANDAVVKEIEEKAVSLGGGDLLRVLENLGSLQGGNIYQHLPGDILDVITTVAEEWETQCAKRLGLAEEAMAFSGLFSSDLRYPLEMSLEDEARLKTWIAHERRRAELRVKRDLASRLKDCQSDVRAAVTSFLELGVLVALGEFTMDFDLIQPEISDSMGISFEGGRHLVLLKEEKGGVLQVQPVNYGLIDERVAVLTGANSGGKTTLLETTAQVQVMAQCGLPVPAVKASVPVLDGLFFFGKNRGGTDAGAFESLLRSFADISGFDGKKLILADEIEAVTEPGAAAKIIAAIIQWYIEDEASLMVLVTHLGGDIKKEMPEGVRIDGIQARGLDEDMNLIVDRNPVLGKLARSTPELIVERLAHEDKNGFFKALSGRFKK